MLLNKVGHSVSTLILNQVGFAELLTHGLILNSKCIVNGWGYQHVLPTRCVEGVRLPSMSPILISLTLRT